VSPVNLGQLPSDQPPPTGLVQSKRSAAASLNFTNAVAYVPITDGYGAPMAISITPTRPGWWVIRAETIWLVAEANWYYATWYVNITPTDADGWVNDYNHMSKHSAQGWQESCLDTVFKLNAGVAYTATMMFGYCNAGTWSVYGGGFSYIQGEFVGEGAL
jgi:hypothetical protein